MAVTDAPSFDVNRLPPALPTTDVASNVNLQSCQTFVANALKSMNATDLTPDAVWRDWLSVTGKVRTFNKAPELLQVWHQHRSQVLDLTALRAKVSRADKQHAWVNVRITFRRRFSATLRGTCSGTVSITASADGTWKIWMLATMLEHLEGHGHPDRSPGASSYAKAPQSSYTAVIVGAGQAGLSVAGRLSALGIDYLLIERQPRLGYGWNGRYDSVRQHTIREYNNLPFGRTFKKDDENLLPASKVVEGLENFAHDHNINLVLSTVVTASKSTSETSMWDLALRRTDGKPPAGPSKLTCKHLILTTGSLFQTPRASSWRHMDRFQGKIMNLTEYKNCRRWKGKHGIVIGSATSAHDVAQDMVDSSLSSVTMVQRSPTAVFPMSWMAQGQAVLYNTRIPTGEADELGMILPEKVSADLLDTPLLRRIKEEPELFDKLDKAGFRVKRDVGFAPHLWGRRGGYYVDVGTSSRIINGDIRVKSGVSIDRFIERGIRFTDGEEIAADLVVIATGFDADYRAQAAEVVGPAVASKMDTFWGLDENGDVRGLMRPIYPGLWMLAGAVPQARFYSRFIALHIQLEALQADVRAEGPRL